MSTIPPSSTTLTLTPAASALSLADTAGTGLSSEKQPQRPDQASQGLTTGNGGPALDGDLLKAKLAEIDTNLQNLSVKDLEALTSLQLNYSIDEDTKTLVVKMVDKDTKEVKRQIPEEVFLRIAKAIDKQLGLLVNEKA